MSAEQAAEDYRRPGAYMDWALDDRADVLDRVVSLMVKNPEPIPGKYMSLCRGVTEYAALELPDTNDFEENQVAHMRGLQWAYALATATRLVQPIHITDRQPGPELDRRQRYTRLRAGVDKYIWESERACMVAGECMEIADPLGEYPKLTFRGIITGLYMADLGLREKRAYHLEKLERAKTEATLRGIQTATEKAIFDEILRASGYGEAE